MGSTIRSHPFDPLAPDEILKAAEITRGAFPGQVPSFRVITLREPLKKDMVPYLEHKNGSSNSPPVPTRTARVQVVLSESNGPGKLHELIVDLDAGDVIKQTYLEGKHPYIDADYMKAVEKACAEDERVKEELAKLDLPAEAEVCIEAWAYATDGMNDTRERTSMCWFYMRLSSHLDANFYAYPLDVCAEVSEQLKVVKVYRLPKAAGEKIHDEPRKFDRRVINTEKAQDKQNEYHPDIGPERRTTTKPYQVVQPEGPSFEVDGNFLTWEKWTMHVGFNYREGLTLHDVRYDGRSVFYRLSLTEMFVPYGDPRCPYPRKGAFDLGNDGAGINANNLQLGCDCLGTIKYFSFWHNTSSGEPLKLPNAVCCHEQDDGILWKHTNFRTGNAVVTRSRVLVLQTIITVNNYEYIFAFHFGQDASIHYEVRATGILSTATIEVGQTAPFGTVVAPGVLAPYHQHLFCLRIDPAIDGYSKNTLVVEESHAMPMDDPKVDNAFGVGYVTKSHPVEHETGLDLDFTKNRVFKMVNEGVVNPITGTPVGFKILPCYSQMLLANPSSFHARRSEFGEHAIWVTRYDDEETFPSGRHTMQSLGGDGIASGIKRRKEESALQKGASTSTSVRNEDIVVWHTFGSTHNPRIEDWPVMPSEKMVVGLKPVNFFTGNPGLDVAVATQENSQSVLVCHNEA